MGYLFIYQKEYCSATCGQTITGATCTNSCSRRGEKYFWCNTNNDDWDYCSRSACSNYQFPSGYHDCSSQLKNRVARFEYNYYPGYWLAASTDFGIFWAEDGIHGSELYSKDEGYEWQIHPSPHGDGSVYIESLRTGWKNYYLAGPAYGYTIDDGRYILLTRGLGYATQVNNKEYHESFAFRILCKDCSAKSQCILWRQRDEAKMYSSKSP